MRTVATDDLQAGMMIAEDFRNLHGVAYLKAGTILTDRSIRQLQTMGVTQATICDGGENPTTPDTSGLQEHLTKTQRFAHAIVKEKLDAFCLDGLMNPVFLRGSLPRIIRKILDTEEDLIALTQILEHDEYTFRHSVGVAIVSGFIGRLCHYSPKKLFPLVRGGFLHDIGKIDVPVEILNKPAKLSNEEFEIVQRHPVTGGERLLAARGENARTLSLMAVQHHQHIDGTGYPASQASEAINRLARVVAIADVYDALTSARSYKVAYKPHIAYRIMKKLSRGQFDERLLDLFFNNLVIFPVGSVLETSAGFAIVKAAPFGATVRPRICVFADDRYHMHDPFEIDLSKVPGVSVSSLLEDISLISLTSRLRLNPAELLENDYPEISSLDDLPNGKSA